MQFELLKKKISGKNAVVVFVGLGKMGLPSALSFAKAGFTVIGIDVSKRVVEECNAGRSPYLEPGLQELLKETKGKFSATLDYSQVAKADVVLCAVPTVIDTEQQTDYSIVEKAFSQISEHLRAETLVVFESNVTPGTTETLVKNSLEKGGLKCGKDFLLGYVPIQGKAGRMLADLKHYERVVAGFDSTAREFADVLFKNAGYKTELASSIKVVELSKLFANIYKDINISIANELDGYCRANGIDAVEVIKHVNAIPGIHLFEPGIGVGGNCLPVDPYFYIQDAESKGIDIKLAKIARSINDARPALFAGKIVALARKGKKPVCLLGMAFRADTHEMAYSPAIEVYKLVKKELPNAVAFDPLVGAEKLKQLGIDSAKESELGDFVKVKLVGHSAFKGIECLDVLQL